MNTLKAKDGSVVTMDAMGASVTFADTGDQRVMDGAIVHAIQGGFIDVDAGVFFQRQLEFIKARSYDVQYAELKARQLFPVSNEAGDGINTITYRTYDQVGVSEIIMAYAKDLPRADIAGKETSIPVRTLGISYGYNIDEIRSAAVTGMPLEQRRANAAVRGNEQTINRVAFYGDAESGMPGFFDNPNIPKGNVVNGGGGQSEWTTKTPDEILFDINDIFNDIFESTSMVEQGNTLMLPPSQWSYIMSTPRASNSDTTIAAFIAANSPFLTSVADMIPVNECRSALNPTLTEDAMVAYDRSPDKLQLEIPVELEMMAAQQKGLEFEVPGRCRLAGVNVYYPLSASIREGI